MTLLTNYLLIFEFIYLEFYAYISKLIGSLFITQNKIHKKNYKSKHICNEKKMKFSKLEWNKNERKKKKIEGKNNKHKIRYRGVSYSSEKVDSTYSTSRTD